MADPSKNSEKRLPRFIHKGLRGHAFTDTYHWLIGLGWLQLLTVVGIGFGLFNLLFASLYLLGGDCYNAADPSSFLEAFSFSVQTMASIGYGAMYPTTPYAHVVSIFEGFFSLLAIAMVTGLMFAKFARPVAKVGFARFAVVNQMDGVETLKIRLANLRHNQVVDARVHVVVMADVFTEEGQKFRRLIDLPLERDTSPVFALSWTLIHVIDEDSPLYGLDQETVGEGIVGVMINFIGLDDTFSQSVHAQGVYRPEDFRYDHRYGDMIRTHPDGTVEIDHARLHDIEST